MATAPPPDFLSALRRRGIALGLDQLQRLGRLAERWEGDEIDSLRAAVSALLATSTEEVDLIREAFDLTWPPPQREPSAAPSAASTQGPEGAAALTPVPPEDETPVARLNRGLRRAGRQLLRLRLLLLCAVLLPIAPPLAVQLPRGLQPGAARLRAGAEIRVPLPSLPTCSEENLPPPLVIYHFGKPGLVAAGAALLAFLLANQARARAEHRRRARRYLRERLDALPAPHQLALKLPALPSALPREDLEDMATLLGRLKGTGQDLDVPRTVDRTLRAGLLLSPVYRERAMGGTVLVLQDLGAAMRPHRRRVEALLSGLARLGVPLERWFFDGDASLIRDRPNGRAAPLQHLARLHGPTPVLVVSDGSGAVDEESGGPAPWVLELERLFPVRTLLHPIPDSRRWHPLLQRWLPLHGESQRDNLAVRRGPLSARPMTRAGVHQAACELALSDEGYTPREARRAVTAEDTARVLELWAIVGEGPLELLELLRQRFAPDTPEEVLLHVLARCGDLQGGWLRLGGEQRLRLLMQGRARRGAVPAATLQLLQSGAAPPTPPPAPAKKAARGAPRLPQPERPPQRPANLKPGAEREIAVRQTLLQLLYASKPAEQDSAARQRYRLAVAVQQLYLPEEGQLAEALTTLQELSRGALRLEVRRTLLPLGKRPGEEIGRTPLPLLAPLPPALRGRVLAFLRDLADHELPPLDGLSLSPQRALLAIPRLAEVLSAAVAALFIIAGASGLRLIPREEIPHVTGAYRLTRDAGAPGFYNVELTASSLEAARAGRLPLQVDLYRDDEAQPVQRGVDVGERDNLAAADEPAPGAGNHLPPIEDDRVRCYHARARLPRGNFALSGQLFVAGARVAPPKGQLQVRFVSGRTGAELAGLPFGVGNAFGETAAGRAGQTLTLTAGPWSLQSEGTPSYGSVTRGLSVRAGALTQEEIVLTDFATLEIAGLPKGVEQAQVLINGIPWRGGEVRVQPGRTQLSLDHPFYDERQEVALRAGERRRLVVEAQPRFGIIQLRVTPARAELSLRGLQLLEQRDDDEGASLWRLRGEAGAYPITASAPAYLSRQTLVDLVAGETLRQDLALEALPVPGLGPGGGGLREPTQARIEAALGPLTAPPADVMLRVPGAVFRMGTDSGEPEQGPAHDAAVATFLIDKTEVTAGAYQRCVQAGSCTPAGAESRYCNGNQPPQRDHPINCVNHAQARAFCAWAGKRLPTEAEWEYAARGADGRIYPWGDEAPSGQLCWRRYPGGGTCAVGSLPIGRSPFGVLDMAGNVAEWTADVYCEYGRTCRDGTDRVVRGGSWYNGNRRAVQAVDRRAEAPANRNSDLGFRCARGAL